MDAVENRGSAIGRIRSQGWLARAAQDGQGKAEEREQQRQRQWRAVFAVPLPRNQGRDRRLSAQTLSKSQEVTD